MKNKIFLYVFLLLLPVLMIGCFEDKGNYDYKDVNEVGVKIEKIYGVRKVDTVFVIRPEVDQIAGTDKGNLQFEWYYNTRSDQFKGDLVSTADTVAITIDPEDTKFSYDHFLRFYIKDVLTGAQYMYPVKLKVMRPYMGSWAVLHEDVESTKLGAVEYIGENMEVTDDVYFKERGTRLKGKPTALGVANYFTGYSYPAERAFFLFTDNRKESGILIPDKGFVAYDTVEHFIYPGHANDFDPTNVSSCEGEGRGRICISNGNLFQGSTSYAKMYKAKISANVTGEVKITHGASLGWTFMVYDAAGHRFLHYYNNNSSGSNNNTFDEVKENTYEIDMVRTDELNINNKILSEGIDPDQQMVYLGTGYWYGPAMYPAPQARVAAYALTVNKKTGYAYAYEFHGRPLWGASSAEDYPFPYFTSFKIPSGMDEMTPVASSVAYNRLFFYAVENKVYRLDFGANGSSTLIYQHPDASAKAVKMEFARKDVGANTGDTYDELYADYGHNVFRSLGVAFVTGNTTGELVILNLNNAGKVDKNDKYPAIQEHKGFGKIKDIKFL